MTNHERAEKIADTIIASMGKAISCSDEDRDWLIEQITSQLDEAVREAVDRTIESRKGLWIAEGFASAREKAIAEIVKYRSEGRYETGHGFMTDLDALAERIRAVEDK